MAITGISYGRTFVYETQKRVNEGVLQSTSDAENRFAENLEAAEENDKALAPVTRGVRLNRRIEGKDKVPYGEMAENGVIEYEGVVFVCDYDHNRLTLGDTSNEKNCINIPLSGGGSLLVNRNNIDALSKAIGEYFGTDYLHFFDAAAPLVTAESVDMDLAWWQSRYDRGTPDYVNCAMDKQRYEAFVKELISAEEAEVHGFEDKRVFEGCMPVEVMARRGLDTLRYGPMKPVGLTDPKTGAEPYAVLQLRQDNAAKSVYNLVGFQTHLKFGEQKRVFSMIPALRNAEFVRYGVMHQNTFLQSPRLLDQFYADRRNPLVAFAGQMTGVEGYVESTASGFLAAVAMAAKVQGKEPVAFPKTTAIGALGLYISDGSIENFQPMNINFSIISPLEYRVRKKAEKNLAISQRALEQIDALIGQGF